MFTIVHMEHETPINGPVVLLLTFYFTVVIKDVIVYYIVHNSRLPVASET